MSAVLLGIAILTALAQREFIAAVAERDGVRSRLAERSAGLAPGVSISDALRVDAAFYLRQLSRRQAEPAIERKRRLAVGGLFVVLIVFAWLVTIPA